MIGALFGQRRVYILWKWAGHKVQTMLEGRKAFIEEVLADMNSLILQNVMSADMTKVMLSTDKT